MAGKEVPLELDLKLDKAFQALSQFENKVRSTLSPDSKAFTKELSTLDQMGARLNMLQGAYNKLSGEKGFSSELAKINAEATQIVSRLQKMATDETTYLNLVKEEVRLRKEASSLQAKPAAQTSTGGGGGGMGLGGFAGAILGGAAVGTALGQLNQLGDKARDIADKFSDGGGKFDQLRQSTLDLENSQKRAAAGIGSAFETVKNKLEAFTLDFVSAAFKDIHKEGLTDEAAKLLLEKNGKSATGKPAGLVGDERIEYQNLIADRAAMEKELAMQRQEFERGIFEARRNLAQRAYEEELGFARKKQDIEKDAARENQDYQLEKTRTVADEEFKASQKQYELDRSIAQRNFEQKQSDRQQDFQNKRSDQQQDFSRDAARSREDFAMDAQERALRGGSGFDFLIAARRFRVDQSRKAQDFATQQGRESRDFGIESGRERRDFGQTQADAATKRQIETDLHRYQVAQKLIDIEIKHQRAVEDSSIAIQRWSEDLNISRQKRKNDQDDLDFKEKTGRAKLDQNEAERRRQQANSEAGFGGSVAKGLDPDSLKKLMDSDPQLADWIKQYYDRSGQPLPTKQGKSAGQSAYDAVKDFINRPFGLGQASAAKGGLGNPGTAGSFGGPGDWTAPSVPMMGGPAGRGVQNSFNIGNNISISGGGGLQETMQSFQQALQANNVHVTQQVLQQMMGLFYHNESNRGYA